MLSVIAVFLHVIQFWCNSHIQVSNFKINSPRQKFTCPDFPFQKKTLSKVIKENFKMLLFIINLAWLPWETIFEKQIKFLFFYFSTKK